MRGIRTFIVLLLVVAVLITACDSLVKPPPPTTGVVYFFFSTTCRYCSSQAPIMEEFHRNNPGVEVIGIPLSASQEAAQAFASSNGLTFEVRVDKYLVMSLGEVKIHPIIAYSDVPDGTLVRVSNGVIPEPELTKSLRSLAGGKTIVVEESVGCPH